MWTLNLVQQGKTPNLDSLDDSDDDNEVGRSSQCITPPPNTVRSKDVKK